MGERKATKGVRAEKKKKYFEVLHAPHGKGLSERLTRNLRKVVDWIRPIEV